MTEIQQRFAQLLAHAPRDARAVAFHGDEWTWERLSGAATSIIEALDGLGLDEGARIGVILRNRPKYVAAVAAVIASGRCITTLSPMQPPDRLANDVDASQLPVVLTDTDTIADPHLHQRLSALGRIVLLSPDGSCTVEPGVPSEPAPERAVLPGVAIEMFTSGTTGKPKRVQLTYRQLDLSMRSAAINFRPDDNGDVVLATGTAIISTPLVHIGGLWNVLAAIYAGRFAVLMDRFDVEEWAHVIETYRPRTAGLVPAAMRMVLDANVPPERLSSLEAMTSGTAACPPELADQMFSRYGVRVLMTYGATEFSGAVAGWTKPMHIEWWDRKKGSAGRPFPGVSMQIVDENGAQVPTGLSGTLEIRTEQAANKGVDWIRTSDLAHLDADGFLWIEGRIDDAIMRGGFKVHPPVVKGALESHPSVREAAVTGIPHERLGAVPVAAVQLVDGAVLDPADLIAAVRSTLTPYEVPVEVLIVEELPRTAAMKINQLELAALFTRTPTEAGT